MMAVDLHCTELLLPSGILYDEEDFLPQNLATSKVSKESSSNRTWEGPNGTGSSFSSPVESELGSAETGSDTDDDYIADLTRQMAHYMLQDDDKNTAPCAGKMGKKTWGQVSSPQSTLWSPLSSIHGSPDGPSPPPTPAFGEDSFWDDAVGMLEKMNLNDGEGHKNHHGQGPWSTSLKPNMGLSSRPALTDDQLRAIEFYRLKREHVRKQHQGTLNWEKQANISQQSEPEGQPQQFQKPARFRGGSSNGGRAGRKPWTPTQPKPECPQQGGSGTRAFFLGSDSGNGSSGTGVFLPRGIWYSSESRKKPGCSTVFIPARVVQALQLHFDQMGGRSRSDTGGSPLQHDAFMGRRNGFNSNQKRQSPTVPVTKGHEMGLPQEWTY